jgi:predicted RNA-binding Zn-ribbon protein involved in translation (DUF1610 family)
MDKIRHLAYCGLYCGACSSMIAYEIDLKDNSASDSLIPESELPCPGCDSKYQKNCEFVLCNQRHQTNSCAFCSEYPCEMIIKFKDEEYEHHQVVLNNLDRIKEVGEDMWLKEQESYWKCPECGSRTIWYQKECSLCHSEIKNNI